MSYENPVRLKACALLGCVFPCKPGQAYCSEHLLEITNIGQELDRLRGLEGYDPCVDMDAGRDGLVVARRAR